MPVRLSARSFATVALALVASACQDALTAPHTAVPPTASVARAQALACTVDVRARTLGCAPAVPAPGVTAPHVGGPQRTLVIGGQDVYVRLTASATDTSGDTLRVPVAVQNLLSQPLATTDGVNYDGRGVMVFFDQLPTTTGGTGAVTVLNPDTTGTFTAANEPAFIYRQFLAGNQTSQVQTWAFSVPTSVTAFHFVVYVRAQLQDEASPLVQQAARVFAGNADAGIVGGAHHTCAVRPGAGVYCWGATAVAVASGTLQDSTSAVPLLVPGSAGAVALGPSTGASHACWLTASGAAACVGQNSFGQLGDGTNTPAQTARAVQMPGGVAAFRQLVLGVQHTCALTSAGAAYCWGFNGLGQLGNGTTSDTTMATAVQMAAGVHFVQLGAGQLHSCGLTAAGAAYCWGFNGSGQLGDGSTTDAAMPVHVQLPAGVTLTRIAGGGNFTCGLAGDGSAYCWGDNTYGQLGDGGTTARGTPARVHLPAGTTLTQIAVGVRHACGRASDGSAYCWGDNAAGQLGDNSYTPQSTPVAVMLQGVTITQLSGGDSHSCAIATTGAAYCWGSDEQGQLGNGAEGSGVFRGAPVTVRMP